MFLSPFRRVFTTGLGCIALAACAGKTSPMADQARCPEAPALNETLDQLARDHRAADPHSLSNPQQVKVQHMGLNWEVDFSNRSLKGSVKYRVERLSPNAPLILDTKDLVIEAVFVARDPKAPATAAAPAGTAADHRSSPLVLEPNQAKWSLAQWKLGPKDPNLGQALEIELPVDATLVDIHYHTKPSAVGLQWLTPSQSADKKTPFLFTQSQAILGRSWIPTQDTPAVRVTYEAKVRVPAGLRAVMSADILDRPPAPEPKVDQQGRQTFAFRMDQAVPNYLIALAVGRLDFAELGPRSGVWAAPSQLKAAKYELAELEKMITATEQLFGPYRWERYDVLFLPAAFPFGGMENPRLTFATPTILAGDRSLISLVAHELAHSWSGNLVTNANWNDIWLNEGFTTYAERRIIEAVYGKDRAEMENMLGRQDLANAIQRELASRPQDQRLAADATGRDPDLLLTNVPYEKGALFLRRLEETYGRSTFDLFIRKWFDTNAFQSVTTHDFMAFLQEELVNKAKPRPGQSLPDLEVWVSGTGIPADAPNPQSDAFVAVDTAFADFVQGKQSATKIPFKKWNAHQQLHFLRAVDHRVSDAQLRTLDQAFGLTRSTNSEILARWLQIAAARRYDPAYTRLEEFLLTVGRRKFLVPIYQALVSTPEGKEQAQSIFVRAKDGYHALSRDSVQKILQSPAPTPAATQAP